jgi:hypothetical protein
VADNQTVPATQDVAVNLGLTGSDDDGDSLTYSVATNPANGSLTGTPPNLQYEPNPGFFGSDSFTFNVSDGIDSSIPAGVVTINVAKNTRPVADGQLVTIAEDGETDITLTGSDADGDVLGFTVLTSPTNGALTGTAPDLHYVADPDVNGTDSFTFQVSDGKGGLSTATVTITVTPVNDAPEADDQTVNLQRDMSASFTVDATDGDGDTLSFSPTTSPANGVLSGSFPNLTYTPTAGFVGIDTLEYTVDDGTATDSATVTFNVVPPNDPPTAGSAVVNVAEDDDVDITLDATDPEGGVVVIEITDAPDHGALTGTAPNLSYEPDADYAGADSFTFTVTDDLDQVSTGTISINVLARNDAPSATAQSVSTAEDTATPVVLGGTDVDDIVLTYQVTSAPAHGTVAGTGGNVTYTPAPNYHGPDSFTFRVRDPQGFTGTATVSITVTPVNDAPKATTLSKTVVEDGSVAMTLAGTDVDGDALTFSVVAAPTKGVLLGTGPAHTYKTNANANGFDTFTYVANDGQVSSPSATATIAITAVNDAPDGVSQAVTAVEDSPTPITVSGTDVDGDALTYKVEIAPMKGTLAGTAPNLVYTPAQDYNGTDAFTFSVTDTKGAKDYTTVSINVIAAPQIATKLTAVPNVIAKLGLLTLKWSYPNMKATLQRADTSAPLAGRTLDFYLGATKACSGVTNSAGTATCSGSSSTLVNGYTVKFNGDHDYAPSTATGTVNG